MEVVFKMGDPLYICTMFVRQKKNKSGSISFYLLKKEGRKQILIKSFGSCKTEPEIVEFENKARSEIEAITKQLEISFDYHQEHISFLKNRVNHIRVIGTELVLVNIFNDIGFNQVTDELFKHLVLSRIIYPGSKLKTLEYLSRHHLKYYEISKVYRYLDKLHDGYKELLQKISYNHTSKLFDGHLSVVFYDVTTLYFEASK